MLLIFHNIINLFLLLYLLNRFYAQAVSFVVNVITAKLYAIYGKSRYTELLLMIMTNYCLLLSLNFSYAKVQNSTLS